MLGGWGFPAPYGHEPLELDGWDEVRFHADIVGGVVGSLCAAHRAATRFDATGHHVNLLFDHETEAIKVESRYTHGALTITLKQPGPLWVRQPSWAASDTVTPDDPRSFGQYLFTAAPPVGVPLQYHYDLPVREILLHHRTRDIRVRLRGDALVAMDNFGADLTFFESFV
jgi:hypothetical protein